MKLFLYVKELFYSNIPNAYWKYDLEDLDVTVPKEVRLFVKHIEKAIDNSLGIIFTSSVKGAGKTTMMCCIAKEIIFKGFHVYYTNMDNVIKESFTEEKEIEGKIGKANVVFIDEFDKVMMKEDSPLKRKIEMNIRSLVSSGKSVVLSTNSSKEELGETFAINDFFERHFKFVNLKEGATVHTESWESRLSSNSFSWKLKNLKDESEKFIINYKR